MCCAHACSAASATRRRVASCAAGFPWASCGVRRMVRCASIRMKPCARRSAPCSHGSPSSDRCAACGCGCAPRACHSRCRPAMAAACAGSTPATSPSIMCSRIPSTRAPTRMARAAMRSLSMPPARARSAYASCRGRNGPCSFRATTKASSIGARTRAIVHGSRPTPIRNHINQVAAPTVLAALAPLGVEAALAAAERIEADHDGALAQWRLAVERAGYDAQCAERRYRTVDPDNRLVARGIEAEWEKCLRELEKAKAELARREQLRPRTLSVDERTRLLAFGADLFKAWQAPTTSPRDKKELLRTLLEEVIITVHKDERRAHLTLRWRGSALTDIDLDLPRPRPAIVRTDEDTIALVRRLAAHYPDAVIAGILNRQDRKSAYGHRFTANLVGNLRRHWNIPRFERPNNPPQGELLTIKQTAAALGVATSTIHRWLNDGIIAGEQLTYGAPWRIRLTADLRARARHWAACPVR